MINKNIYKKSYLLEIYDRSKANITDAFCFSVPPENEEFTHTQRISQTKTYGGLCVDRYGNEAVKISLGGSTINQEFKYIFRSSLAAKNLNGEQEIFYLRDMLEKANADENAELRLYDLSKSAKTTDPYQNGNTSYISSWWNVYLDQFKIKRDKSKPFTYTYQIEFTAIPEKIKTSFELETLKIKDIKTGKTELVEQIKNSPSSITMQIENGINKMRLGISACNKAYEKAGNFIDQLSIVTKYLDEFESVFNDYAEAIQNFHSLRAKAVTQVVKIGDNILRSSMNICIDTSRTLVAACQAVKDSVLVFKDIYEDVKKLDPYKIYSEEKLNALQTSIYELTNSGLTAANEVIEGSNEIVANFTKSIIPVLITNTDENGNDYVVTSYGAKKITIKEGDSLENLSYEHYGTTDYVPMLENYNNLSDDDLIVGNEFNIPLLEPDPASYNNDIYANNTNIGTDIKLTETGDIDIFCGDVAEISDTENLNQAVNLRLSAYMGSNVRNVLYGLRNTTGENTSSNSYLLASLEQTLSKEPRIKSIDNITYTGNGDNLIISVSYTDVNENKREFNGVI